MTTVICKDAVARILGKKPTDAQVKAVEKHISKKMRELARSNPAQWAGLSAKDRIVAGADQAVAELRHGEKEAKRRAVLSVQAARSNRLAVEALKRPNRNWATAILDHLQNVYVYQQTLGRAQFGVLKSKLDAIEPKSDFIGWLQNPRNIMAFMREVDGTATGNAVASKAAKVWLQTTDEYLARLNRSGADVGKLDYGYLPRIHDIRKIQKVVDDPKTGRNQWVEDVLPWIKTKQEYYLREDGSPMSDDELRAFLKEAKISLDTEGALKGEPGKFKGSGVGAARLAGKHRELHFSADAWAAYNAKYGKGTLYDAINAHVHGVARDTALFENLGPNPEGTFRYINDIVKRNDGGQEQTGGVGSFFVLPTEAWDVLSGRTAQAVNKTLAQVALNTTNLLVSARLGKAIFPAISDLGTTFLTAHYNKASTIKAYSNALKLATSKKARRALEAQGIVAESLIGSGNRFMFNNMTHNWSSKAAHATLKYSLLHGFTDNVRDGYSIAQQMAFGEVHKTPWNKLDADDIRRLTDKGITEADWKAWQQAKLEDWRGTPALTPNAIGALTDAQLRPSAQPRLDEIAGQADASIDKLLKRNTQEQDWIAKRTQRFDDLAKRLQTTFNELSADKTERATKAKEAIAARMDEFEAARDFAKVRTALEADTLTGDYRTHLKVREYLKARIKPDSGLSAFSHARGKIGEDLGRREIAARTKLKEARARIRKIDKSTLDYLDAKDQGIGNRLLREHTELSDFVKRSENRQKQRELGVKSIAEDAARQSQEELSRTRDRTLTKYLAYLNDESYHASLAPDLLTRAALTRSTRPGTVAGSVRQIAALFASFPISMITRHWRRAARLDTGAQAAYLATLIATHTALGAISVQARNLLFGKDPESMETPKFWGKALLYGGALGWIGDSVEALLGTVRRYQGKPDYGSVLGAGPAAFVDVAAPLGSGAGAALGYNKPEKFYQDAFSAVKGFTPFSTLWWIEGPLNHLLLHDLQESLNPGYLRRMEQTAYKDQGTKFYWRPGTRLPQRAPDLGAAFRPPPR